MANHANSRQATSASGADWVPTPIAQGDTARYWRRVALRAQFRLHGHTWSADQLRQHRHRVQETLPDYSLLQYPFNNATNDTVILDAYRIISQWINDTVPHIYASQGVLDFMSDLPYNIHYSSFADTMGYHFVLYKTVTPYIHQWVFYMGRHCSDRQSFGAWLDRQHPTIHAMFRNVETGLRRRLCVWLDPLVCTRWSQMKNDLASYQAPRSLSTDDLAAWFVNRPEYLKFLCNFRVYKKLALALHLIADLDFSKENVSFENPGRNHGPHIGCRENCPLVDRIVYDDEDIHTEDFNQVEGNIPTPGDTTESEDESPYGTNHLLRLCRRPAFQSLRRAIPRRARSWTIISGSSCDSIDEEGRETFVTNDGGPSHAVNNTPQQQPEQEDSADDTSDDDDDWDNKWDSTWNSEVGNGEQSLPVIRRPPTPFVRAHEEDNDDESLASHHATANAQNFDRPGTPHPWMGRNGVLIANESIPHLDLGAPMVSIEESDSQTSSWSLVAAASPQPSWHYVDDSNGSSCEGSFVDTSEFIENGLE